jgi:hypothetical protein
MSLVVCFFMILKTFYKAQIADMSAFVYVYEAFLITKL